ncbi:hypothetical protein [Endozoicomonas arenosclerae]|uniref:hypothetical protein n=1 Tax=Endozoicomonas arenosclerae TaxID=1633495 RepID=UPI000785B1ED|nr:hypothetical protein [Endozoicomonas arenosclerae]
MRNYFLAVLVLVSVCVKAEAPPGQWVTLSLDQIELTPASGWFTGEGVWFASDTPYESSFDCTKSRYVVIKDKVFADRALSLALYAKSMNLKLRAYVVGCDSLGHLEGRSVMLIN